MTKSLLDQVKSKKDAKPTPKEDVEDIFDDVDEITPEIIPPKAKKPKKQAPITEDIASNTMSFSTNTDNQKFELAPMKSTNALALPSKEEVDYRVNLIEYIKKSIVSREDYGEMHGKTFLKASGHDKFVHYFKLNISYPKRDIYEDKEGWHCEVTCKVEAPWGQSVEADGSASMNTMTIRKTRHNMKALAETRAKTRALRTIMGFSQPSYEEMIGSDEVDDWF